MREMCRLTGRAALGAAALLAGAGLVLTATGCFLIPAGSPQAHPGQIDTGGTGQPGNPGTGASGGRANEGQRMAFLQIRGSLRVGNLATDGGVVFLRDGSPLTSSAPLAGVAPGLAPAAGSVEMVDAPALTADAEIVRWDPESGQKLIGNNSANYRNAHPEPVRDLASVLISVASTREQVRGMQSERRAVFVEAVDPSTGELLGRIQPDGGAFSLIIPASGRRAVALQALGVAGNRVVSFLASPVAFDPDRDRAIAQDITPATTVQALSPVLLAGVRSEFSVERGFRGFRSRAIANLIGLLDTAAARRSAERLDGTISFRQPESPGSLLQAIAAGSGALVRAVAGHAASGNPTLGTLVGAANAILARLGDLDPAGADVAVDGAIEKAAREVAPEDVARAAEQAGRRADDSGSGVDLNAPIVLSGLDLSVGSNDGELGLDIGEGGAAGQGVDLSLEGGDASGEGIDLSIE